MKYKKLLFIHLKTKNSNLLSFASHKLWNSYIVYSHLNLSSLFSSGLAATASAQGDDASSSELERTDLTLGSSYRASPVEVEDPEVSLLGELSEISEAGNQPHFLGNQANKVKSGKDRMNRWNSSFRRVANVKGKSTWRPTVRRKSYNKIKPMFKEKLTEKVESKDNSVIKTPECTLNLQEDKASTLDFPIPLGKWVGARWHGCSFQQISTNKHI